MLIDGQLVAIRGEQQRQAREQLGLPADFILVDASRILRVETRSGQVLISLPEGLLVVEFENAAGHLRYGVVKIEGVTPLE